MIELDFFLGKHLLGGCEYGRIEITEGYCEGDTVNTLNFVIDGKEYSVIEDCEDGYRSSMQEIIELPLGTVKNRFPAIEVIGTKKPDDDDYYLNKVIILSDVKNGLPVVEFGTENYNDWYPMFISSFYPQNMSINQEIALN